MLIESKTIWTPDNSNLLRYKEEIDAGEIIVGQELYLELENLEEDIKHGDEYVYNTEDAELRMDFMQNCIRLTKSPYYGKPMKLMLWQKAFIEALYSFKMKGKQTEDGDPIDRFKKAILLIARKNTKSETCSALGNAEFIVGNEGADIVCSSNDDAQASIVYDAIDTMRQLYDPNDLDTRRNQRFIMNRSTNTKIFKLSDRTKNKEGRNIDWAILDEAHEMQTNVIAKSIEQSQSIKDNPKFIIITTEGFTVDGYLDGELKAARAIVKGEDDSISASRVLPWLYTQDSEGEIFQNKRSWMKSNPTLGIVKKWDYLEEQVDLAKKSKADRIFVLSKDFNFKQNGVESWLNIEDYSYDAKYDIEDFRGAFCLGHVDLAETTDLCCAKALVMLPEDKTKYIITQYFIPQSKLDPENDDHNAGAKYKEWAQKGYITICEGNDIDLTIVADWFYKLKKEHGINLFKCGYDQRFAKEWLKRMEDYGWMKQYEDVEMVIQNAQTLNNALLLVEADLKAHLINYNENPVDRWCFKNSCLKVNDLRQALIIKTENQQKIDGSVTLVSLYEMYRRHRSDFKKLAGGRKQDGMVR
jgi:phage terminase large subunit-like protein